MVSKRQYRPEIDGLRAVAIIPVVIFHFFPTKFPHGFLGVDVFFVISGFLITGILLRDFEAGTFSMPQFWARRIRRLFPVMATMIITVMVTGYFTLFGDEWRSLAWQATATIASVANLLFWRVAGDYWGQTAESMPLLHMWSLAVEEQFYLFFPPSLWLSLRFFGRRVTQHGMICICIVSFLLMLSLNHTNKAASFYLLPTRGWELLAGCILAVYVQDRSCNRSALTSKFTMVAGLSLIAAGYFLPFFSTGYSLFHAAGAVLGTTLVLTASALAPPTTKWCLRFPPLVGIGKISYSWYMWHWPMLIFVPKVILISPLTNLILTLVASVCSYAVLENCTRFLPTRRFVYVANGLLVAVLLSICMPNGLQRRAIEYTVPETLHQPNIQPPYIAHVGEFSGDYKTGVTAGALPTDPLNHVLLLGDSHGVMYYPMLLEICRDREKTLTSFAADGGTWPFFVVPGTDPSEYYAKTSNSGGWTPERRLEFDTIRRDFIQKHSPKLVIICGRWDFYFNELGIDRFESYVKDVLSFLPGDCRFLILGQPPMLPFGSGGFTSGVLDIPVLRAFTEDPAVSVRRHSAHTVLARLAAESSRGEFVFVDGVFETARGIRFLDGAEILYRDDDHLNTAGAFKCRGLVEAAFNQASQRAKNQAAMRVR